ncbi:hypothetical protein QKU48_gp0577 [Fadolivirus algeromassiliense]|jgi:hypothetical protein|uniref:Uncharacterized protein n=1 Tax=Fadolivirus FV1/VV64 TaxID=3070911 RepID=A0A7D3V5I6_9VIRU|nr:hypothetical protein QKU48_gp0577 [Fadolivirus algeromassiliense]QKF94035.1 hypothetical protein Fadolivirus_1_577 [Fadolivirus FV1/VV64]
MLEEDKLKIYFNIFIFVIVFNISTIKDYKGCNNYIDMIFLFLSVTIYGIILGYLVGIWIYIMKKID